jgi:radical SAM protein with 4Fe4S-binding SPASM domain
MNTTEIQNGPENHGVYKSYTILFYQNVFFAIPVFLGPVNLNIEEEKSHPSIIQANTIDEIYKKIDNEAKYVKRIRVEITENCNLRCLMCDTYNGVTKKAGGKLDIEKFNEHLTPKSLSQVHSVHIGNVAEPMIHPEFDKIIKHIRKCSENATIYILTNGNLIHKFANVINENRCTLHVSIDSLNHEKYAHLRRGGKLQRVLDNLKLIDSSRVQVYIDQALMVSNMGEYEDFIHYCQDNGFLFTCRSMFIKDYQGIITRELIDETLWFRRDLINEWKDQYWNNDFGGIVQSPMIRNVPPPIKYDQCTMHWDDLQIDSKGDCHLCLWTNIGNLNTESLHDIWFGGKAERLRQKIDRNPEKICAECEVVKKCYNPSIDRVENYFSERIISSLSPECMERIAYDSDATDEERKQSFIKEILKEFHIFTISENQNGYVAIPFSGEEQEAIDDTVITEKTLDKLYGKLTSDFISPSMPFLVNAYKQWNIIKYRNKFYASPWALGDLNISIKEHRERDEIITSSNVEDLYHVIDKAKYMENPEYIVAYHDFNIVGYMNMHYAIPEVFGAFEINQKNNCDHHDILKSKSLENLKEQIDLHIPEFIESLNQYNLVKYYNKYYAIPLALGELNLLLREHREQFEILVSADLKELQNIVELAQNMYSPKLVLSYFAYNIVGYLNKFYAVPSAFGIFDLNQKESRNHNGVIQADTMEHAKYHIDSELHHA